MKTADIITLHPGKQHNFEQVEQLLHYFPSVKHITSLAVSKEALKKYRFLPKKILTELDKRSVTPEVALHTDAYPWQELIYKYKRISGQSLPYSFFKNRNRRFQQSILKKYTPPRIFIGFDTSSELIFEAWKDQSTLILDLTIAIPQYKRKLAVDYQLSAEALHNLTDGDELWYLTYEKELNLADYILCGSQFVKDSCLYLGVPESKLKVIPYGANLKKFVPSKVPFQRNDQPFKVAFVGNVSYRKGADILLGAWAVIVEKYKNVELHFYGNLQIDLAGFNLTNVFFHGFVPQDQLIQELSESHVSILPTFFEGSSYAIYQSMALGLGVITTPNCGSVINGVDNGMLIEYGSGKQISDALNYMIEQKEIRLSMSEKAMQDIKEYSWDAYGVKLQNFIASL